MNPTLSRRDRRLISEMEIPVSDAHADLIRRYLEDAIAAERSFETQLRNFASDGDDDEVKETFAAHAEETRIQHELLAARLE